MPTPESPFSDADCPNGLDGGVVLPLPVVQFLRLRRQIPAMYLLLVVNTATLAALHMPRAPWWLTVIAPVLFIAVCLFRRWQWLKPVDTRNVDPAFAQRMLQRTAMMSGALSLGYLSWALVLDQYGGPTEHAIVAVFIAITVLGCVFCLNYLPGAAQILCSVALTGYLVYCLAQGNLMRSAIAINVILVGLLVLKVSRDSFALFVTLEGSRRDLHAQRQQALALGEENARLAHSDMLTGLPNRRYFFAQLERLVADAGDETEFCIALVDLDRFKPINDTLGHAQGDRLLQAIAAELAGMCDAETHLARLGGDEFGMIVRGSAEAAQRMIQRMSARINLPVQLGDVRVTVGCSIGLAAFPGAGRTAHALFDHADFALYHAKKHARGGCVRFSAALEQMIRSEQALEAALHSCDFAAELKLAFQPIIRTGGQGMTGVEALARWTSPTFGHVPPEMLFACAERLGIARTVTLALFDQALDALRALPGHLRLSFNLAAQDIADDETVATLLARLERSGVEPRRMVFEVTETCLIQDFDAAHAALTRLREPGALIALDDFGTGYSSLSSLHRLPIDIVKIDRSFTPRLATTKGRQFLGAILNLARSLQLECVFEGIETEQQVHQASLIGCSYLQGYFLAVPGPLAAILDACAQDTGGPDLRRIA